MKDYYVFQNVNLEADERVLRILGTESRRLPVEEISGLHLLAGYSLTSGVIDLAAEHHFPIHAYGFNGSYHGTFFPPPVEATSSILISQVKARLDAERRVGIARSILQHANESMNAILNPFRLTLDQSVGGETVEALLLSEARVRKEYYALLDTLLPPFWSIVTRGRQPPKRPADAVLSFANGVLYAKTGGWTHRAGLDPRIGYLHGEARAKNPLSLDLAEVLKPTLSEAILLEVAASGAERSLVTDVGDGVYLNEAGRKTVIRFMEEILKRSVRPRGADREDIVATWAAAIPRKLHRALVTSEPPTFPVLPCTLSSSTMRTLENGRTSVPSS